MNEREERIAELRRLVRKEETRLTLHAAFDTRPLAKVRAELAELEGKPPRNRSLQGVPLDWDQFKTLQSDDDVKTDLELTHIPCGQHLCDVEAGDTMLELTLMMVNHVCGKDE